MGERLSDSRYPSYGPTDVKWLGNLPSHWEVAPLKRLVTCNDEVLPESTSPDHEIEYVEVSDVNEQTGISSSTTVRFENAASRARRIVRHGDIIISTVRTYLRAIASVTNPPPNLIVSTGFAVLRPRKIQQGFARYALSAEYFVAEVISRSTGVSYPAINASELMRIHVPVPPASEQIAIAAFLDRETANIDHLIAKQERLIGLLTEKRQSLVEHAIGSGINPAGHTVESGVRWLGRIPPGWQPKRLKQVSPFITVGIVVNPSTYVATEGVPFIYGGDIREGMINLEGARRISPNDSIANSKTRLQAGDLLTVRVGAPGVTAVVPPEAEGGNCASVMLIRRGQFDSRWLCYVMNSRLVRRQVEVVQYGAAQEQFNISHAVNWWVPTPPRDEQARIADYLDHECQGIDALIAKCRRAIDLLREHRASLISAVVTGKIRVPEDVETSEEMAVA